MTPDLILKSYEVKIDKVMSGSRTNNYFEIVILSELVEPVQQIGLTITPTQNKSK